MSSNPLDDALNNDFVTVITASPLLLEAFNGLPEDQRDAVMANWNNLQWQTIMAAAAPDTAAGWPKDIPLQLGFNLDPGSNYGFLKLAREIPNLHEYAITPAYDSATGRVDHYGIIHRTLVYSPELLQKVLNAEAKHESETTTTPPTPATE